MAPALLLKIMAATTKVAQPAKGTKMISKRKKNAVYDDDTCVYNYSSVTYTLSLSRFIHKVVFSDIALFSDLPIHQVEIASRRMTVLYLTSSH